MSASRRDREPASREKIRAAYEARRKEIRARLREFREVWKTGSDDRLWEELVYCIFTAGASAHMRLRDRLRALRDRQERRDWLAREPRIKGLGYKEASHFLRNVGFKGYAILDKHILSCLNEVGVVDSPRPPTTRKRYLDIESRMQRFAAEVQIDFDELDLVLWSMKTGEILK